LKILINAIPLLSLVTGIGKYTYYVSKFLKEIDINNNYTYFYGYYSKEIKEVKNLTYRKTFHKIKDFMRLTPASSFFRKIKSYYASLRKINFDIYFEPNFIFIDAIKSKKRVVSVHDFSFDLYPEWHPEDRVLYFKENFLKSIKKADRIILPSNFIFDEAVNKYKFDKSALRVVYLGVDNDVFREYSSDLVKKVSEKYQLPENYILFVGSIEPRKNLKNLILAYDLLPDYLKKDFSLVLTGFSGWKNKEIMAFLDKNRDKIIYTGYVSENELALIYNKASVFVFPSFYEGFGLPPLEAMACGCPVIVSDRASLPEVCSDSALYVNPHEPEDIADKIMKVLENQELRENLRKKGIQRSQSFKWENTAKDILNIFEEVAID